LAQAAAQDPSDGLAQAARGHGASATKALRIGGEGRAAEIDGAYFGGHWPLTGLTGGWRKTTRASGQVVIAMRERSGRAPAQVFAAETDALGDNPAADRQRYRGSCR
jgi:hypothetical protein